MKPDEYQSYVIKNKKNMLVLAGAGTGKTFCIVNKVLYLKEQYGATNEDFLIISFTNESVNDLKRKINIDNIYTFHKLALHILNGKYTLCNESLLTYIINEYFYSFITASEKKKILFYYFSISYAFFLKSSNFKDLKKIILTYIMLIKANNLNTSYIISNLKHEKDKFIIGIILKIYTLYEMEKESQNKLDLDDLIIRASKIKKEYSYKYIFIDEFQDTSQIRFDLIYNIYKNSNSKLFLFGDDFQSIYRFTGCNLNIMLDIKKYIYDIEVVRLRRTFRNSQELINIANQFITRNPKQLKKDMISDKSIKSPIEIIRYTNPKKEFLKLIKKLDMSDVLILGRNNNDLLKYTGDNYRYLTIHKSKGLECKNIIIINVENSNNSLPSKIKNYYLIDKINDFKEIKYAEERRLFYVALTRTKEKVYILTPKNNESIFIKELEKIIKQNKKGI